MSIYNKVCCGRFLPLLIAGLFVLLLPRLAHAQSIDEGLVGYWPFDAANPTVDLSGNGNTATLNSGLQLTTDVAPTAFANTRALLSTPNANNYATAPGNGIDNLTDYTVAFWLRVNSAATGTGDVLALGNRLVIQVRKLQSGQFILDIRFPLRVYPYPVEAVIESNGWNHVVVAIKGSVTDIYFNGQRAQNETYLAGSSGTPSGGLTFSSSNAPLNGILDDVRIYNRVLNASEVAALPYNCNNAQGVPANECQALVNLFRNTDGMKWTNHTNWLQNDTPCNWFGVLCNAGHVFVLSLPQNNLRGPLPPALGNLATAIIVQLPNNHLIGELPFELGNLSQLQTLDLYGNQLSGQVPFTLGNLSKLTTLRLYNNQLRGSLPQQLGNLTGLLTLDLGYNMLTAQVPTLFTFLNSTQPDWAATQTVPPTNLKATLLSSSSISLTWTPISYTEDSGYYEVLSTTQASGIYSLVGKTNNISATGYTVTGLTAGQNYSFVVRTFVAKHGLQQNDLLSDSSDPVAITLTTNRPPLANDDSYSTQQDTPLTVDVAHGLLANDSDPDGNGLQIGSISGINPGSQFALNLDGSFTYTPAVGFAGTESFTYQASDGQALSNPATVSFTVSAKSVLSATLTIVLDVQPNSRTNFSFVGSLGSFKLDDISPQDSDSYSNSKSFTVPAGTYTVTEQALSGYLDASISCNPPSDTIADLFNHQIVINAGSGADITCTFVVQREGQIIAGAYNDHNHNHQRNSNDEWLNGWQMQLHSPFDPQPVTQVTAGEGRTVFNHLFAGSYTVCEVQQSSWFNITPTTLNPTYNQPCYTINVTPGQAVWIRFGNSTTPLVTVADVTDFEDIVICDLPATDDAGNITAAERDPWEEEEEAGTEHLFLPMVSR
ncbi:MAG: LamG-like jellyroll fold domain-containing protein [Caldilineaceae bacterium]